MDSSQNLANRSNPLLSIVIPAYNVEEFILPAVYSALRQTYSSVEILIVDDGSSDATLKLLETIRDSRVRIIRQENRGLAGARNTGIQESKGEYIGLLDGDDVWYPEKGEALVRELERDLKLGIAFSNAAYIDENGKPTGQFHITRNAEPTIEDVIVRNVVAHPVVRKDCFLQAGLFDESLRQCEDYEMWVRILAKTSYTCRSVSKVLYGYRVRSGSLMTNYQEFLDNACRVIETFEKTVPQFNVKLKKRALAEIYRITSRRALSSGQIEKAWELMQEVFRQCPLLVFYDIRAFGTCGLIFIEKFTPTGFQRLPYKAARIFMKQFYRLYNYVSSPPKLSEK